MIIFSSATNTTQGVSAAMSRADGHDLMRLQVDFPSGTTGSIALYGRLSPDLQWVLLNTVTANDISSYVFTEYLQATLTGVAGGGVVQVGVAL